MPGTAAKIDGGAQETAKSMIIASKTFREGAIYLYQRSDFKKPTWLCRIAVQCADLDQVEAALCTIRAMAWQGDFDDQLAKASAEIRAKFKG